MSLAVIVSKGYSTFQRTDVHNSQVKMCSFPSLLSVFRWSAHMKRLFSVVMTRVYVQSCKSE